MTDKLEFELVSPAGLVFSRDVDMVVVPGAEGDMGILASHAPAITAVRPGTVTVMDEGAVTDRYFVGGGIAEVTAERCTVLAEEAIELDEIDRDLTEQQAADFREDLAAASDEAERDRAALRLAVAEAKLEALDTQIY